MDTRKTIDMLDSDLRKAEFKRMWSREAVNEPGIMVETVALRKDPIIVRRPVMRKPAISA